MNLWKIFWGTESFQWTTVLVTNFLYFNLKKKLLAKNIFSKKSYVEKLQFQTILFRDENILMQNDWNALSSNGFLVNTPDILHTLFLKRVHPEYQVNHRNHSFASGWDKLSPWRLPVSTALNPIPVATVASLILDAVHKTKFSVPHWIFYFFLK